MSFFKYYTRFKKYLLDGFEIIDKSRGKPAAFCNF